MFTVKTTLQALLYNPVNIKHRVRGINQIPLKEQKYKKVAIIFEIASWVAGVGAIDIIYKMKYCLYLFHKDLYLHERRIWWYLDLQL